MLLMHFSSTVIEWYFTDLARHSGGIIIKLFKLIRPIKTIKSQKDFLGHLVQDPSHIKVFRQKPMTAKGQYVQEISRSGKERGS